jgi:hypothetical protein
MRNIPLIDQGKFVIGLDPAVPSTSTPDYVSLKNANRVTVLILVKNATTVTGSAITLKQATAVAGTGEKALAFDTVYVNTDTAAGDTLTKTAVTSNTFTTNATNSKNLMYQIEVKASDLDVTNGFDCIRAGTGDATAATVTVLYFLHSNHVPANAITAITD